MFLLAIACAMLRVGDSFPKGATCNFSWDMDSTHGQRLLGHIVGQKSGVSLLQCLRACLDLDSRVCRSINYNRGNRECQLNGRDSRLEPGSMTASPGWKYYHKRVSSPERIEGYNGDHCYVNKCPPTTIQHNDRCIEINAAPLGTFSEGRKRCRDKYGSLISILDANTWGILMASVSWSNRYYVGFSRAPTDTLIWEDGSPVNTNQYFIYGQPDDFNNNDGPEDCGGLEDSYGNKGLNDIPCVLSWSFICEYDKWVYSLW